MYTLPEKARTLIPYNTDNQSYDIQLNSNESFIDVASELKDKLQTAMSKLTFNRYPDPKCTHLREVYSNLMGVPAELISTGNGSDELIWILQNAFLKRGDSLLIFSPDFSMYQFYGSLCEINIVDLQREDGLFQVDKAIEIAKKENVGMLIFSNPCNPTSLEIPKSEVLRLADSLDCLVVVDEAYMEFGKESVIHDVEKRDNLIVLRTCSKAIGSAGLRIGFSIACKTLADKISAAASPYHINTVTQAVAAEILSDPDYVKNCIDRIIASRDSLQNSLNQLKKEKRQLFKVFPSQTNFIYLRIIDADTVYKTLKEKSILVRLIPGHLRITCGTELENKAVVDALDAILK